MYTISEINIKDFRDGQDVSILTNSNVNILVGRNGTGKTRLLDILNAVFSVDTTKLRELRFKKLSIVLFDEGRKTNKNVLIDVDFETRGKERIVVKYVINKIAYYVIDENQRRSYFLDRDELNYGEPEDVRERLSKLVEFHFTSVSRFIKKYKDESYSEIFESMNRVSSRKREKTSDIDSKIAELIQSLSNYLLKLSSKSLDVTRKLEESVLRTILYNPDYDTVEGVVSGLTSLTIDKQRLLEAYTSLGLSGKEIEGLINKHVNIMNKVLYDLRSSTVDDSAQYLSIESLLPSPLIKRTGKIVELSLEAEKERESVYYLFSVFNSMLKEFMWDKHFTVTNDGNISIVKNNKSLDIDDLSSGEKQVFILLITSLLQDGKKCVFLIDEPEVSLHVTWQERIIGALKEINPHAQFLIATHSPEIAGQYSNSLIDMEDFLR